MLLLTISKFYSLLGIYMDHFEKPCPMLSKEPTESNKSEKKTKLV